jgi:ADP-ribosylglycohydrolase
MAYPKTAGLESLCKDIELYAHLKHEYGAAGIGAVLGKAEAALRSAKAVLERLPADKAMAAQEPSDLAAIRGLRPDGARRLWKSLDQRSYASRLEGALLGRMAGCTLGAPVEGWEVPRMEALARQNGTAFPPADYWTAVPEPDGLRYNTSPNRAYTRDGMNGVAVDDDIAYTLLGLLILEDHGVSFTVDDVGKAWVRYLPLACTAEDVALANLKAGRPAARAAERDNPFCEWIGADIRSDPWGYAAPGWPERAADLAWRDACISHRRQGIFGEMYFSAAIAAAFAVDDPVEALRIGLTEIPRSCALAKAVQWALEVAPGIHTYRDARQAMDARFPGMHHVHTINNACLTIWGITIGGTDLTRVIGETVAMGMDNDCTAATAGSIVGAVIGKDRIPGHWYARFNDTVHSYLIGRERFSIADLVGRFERQARLIHGQAFVPAVTRPSPEKPRQSRPRAASERRPTAKARRAPTRKAAARKAR